MRLCFGVREMAEKNKQNLHRLVDSILMEKTDSKTDKEMATPYQTVRNARG